MTAMHKVFRQTASGNQAVDLEKAAINLRAILEGAPNDANCLHVLGLIECQLGNMDEAEEWIGRSLHERPNSADVQCHYALIKMQQGKFADAVTGFQKAIAIAPNHVDAHYNLGNALNESGKIAEAAVAFDKAITLKPDHVEALNNLGNIFNNNGNPTEAVKLYRRAVAVDPSYAMAHNNMGLAHTALDRLETAVADFRNALAVAPEYPEAHNNLGIALRLKGRFVESRAWYEKALTLRPDYGDAHNNLANALKDSGDLDSAIAHYEEAIRIKDTPDHRHNLALALLTVGRFEEGWRTYESRWHMRQMANARRQFTQPQWQGEAGAGRTLLIHAEQGFGDTLQFCRFAPLVKARGFSRVILEVQPGLVKLLKSLKGVDEVIPQGHDLPAFDVQCPTMSLPFAFGTTDKNIPVGRPYLSADKDLVDAWDRKLGNALKMRVGLVWAGSARLHSPDLVATDRRRSLAPEMLAPLLDVPGVQFYNLQKTGPQAGQSFGLIDHMPECNDFADTAALVANLDLVITVDTAMAHLAGALGKPVWMLNRFDTCWRWLLARDDSPWYPSMRLFRQTTPGDWRSVIRTMGLKLERTAAAWGEG